VSTRALIAVGLAIFFSLTSAYFGWSFVFRLRQVHTAAKKLEEQAQNWGRRHQPAIDEFFDRVSTLSNQVAAEDVSRQVAATRANVITGLAKGLQQELDATAGPIERMQDAFEDEFGRRVTLSSGKPPQYDAGAPPSLTRDPLRMGPRTKIWAEAKLLCETYNTLSRRSLPQLEMYEKELAAQQQAIRGATQQWEALKSELALAKAELDELMRAPQEHFPSPEEIRRKVQNSAIVGAIFGLSDAAGFLTSLTLAAGVWFRVFLIAGWLRLTRIVTE